MHLQNIINYYLWELCQYWYLHIQAHNHSNHLPETKPCVSILRYDWYFSAIHIQKLKSRWLQILKVFWTSLPVPLLSLNKQQHDPECCQTRQAVSKTGKCCCALNSFLLNFAWFIFWRTPDRFFALPCVCGNWWALNDSAWFVSVTDQEKKAYASITRHHEWAHAPRWVPTFLLNHWTCTHGIDCKLAWLTTWF